MPKQSQTLTRTPDGHYAHGRVRASATNDAKRSTEPPGWVRSDTWHPGCGGQPRAVDLWALSPRDDSPPFFGQHHDGCVACSLRHPHTSALHDNQMRRHNAVYPYCSRCAHNSSYHACTSAQAQQQCPAGVERHYS